MKGCISHFAKWQIHPFISKGGALNRVEIEQEPCYVHRDRPSIPLMAVDGQPAAKPAHMGRIH